MVMESLNVQKYYECVSVGQGARSMVIVVLAGMQSSQRASALLRPPDTSNLRERSSRGFVTIASSLFGV
jgi:hypothetical protein